MTSKKVSISHKLLARLVLPPEGPSGVSGLENVDINGLENVDFAPVLKAQERIEAARRVLGPRVAAAPDMDGKVLERLLKDAEEGLRKLESDREYASLKPAEAFGLEAVIESDGSRPVLFVQDGMIDVDSPDLTSDLGKHWRGAAIRYLDGIRTVAASVGAIQLPAFDKKRVGTGFAIAPGLILTNRHVLEEIARFQDGTWSWKFDAEIDFHGEFEREGSSSFRLESVVRFGPNPINRQVNFANLDFAVIQVRDSAEFPKPLEFERSVDVVRVDPRRALAVYVMGFPAEPWTRLPGDDPGPIVSPAPKHEYQGVLERLFKDRFGSKRWAPGYVGAGAGQLALDERKWVMSHDASTLAGNSGSCVVDFSNNGARVMGLHFGGKPRVENWAHVIAALQQEFNGMDMTWVADQ